MGYYTACDWCDADLRGKDSAKLPVTIRRTRTNPLDRRWAEETKPTLFFCVAPEPDREGRNRMGLPRDEEEEPDNCYERAMRAIKGTPTSTPDMGMEWRLVPAGAVVADAERGYNRRTPPSRPVAPDADLDAFLGTLAPSPKHALRRALGAAGVATLDCIAALSDEELMAMRGIGWNTCCKVRQFIKDRDAARGESREPDGDHPLDAEPVWRNDMDAYPRREVVSAGLDFPATNTSYYRDLRALGIETIGDLRVAVMDDRLLRVRGIGPSTLARIRLMLERLEPIEGLPA